MESTTTVSNLMLKVARAKMGLSQDDMANMIHISTLNYCKLENNKKKLRLKEMVSISKVTNMSMEELFN
jgi:DNA-binding XRE family transcriptional regulator